MMMRPSVSLPQLPSDTVKYDILTRVPIDSLMRFKCVCKSWSDLTITDPVFIKLHNLRRRQTNSERGFICLSKNSTSEDGDADHGDGRVTKPSGTKSNGIVFFDLAKKEKKVFRFRPESGLLDKKLIIHDSLNGLVLLSCHTESGSSNHVYIYNPITGYSYKLPVRNAFVHGRFEKLHYHLVYDSVMEKYKVLCLCSFPTSSLKIVTLGTENDPWRNIDCPIMYPCEGDGIAVFANGSFHWMTRDYVILSIDVSSEVFYTTEYPEEGSQKSRLLEVEGSLCFLDCAISKLFRFNKKPTTRFRYEPDAYKGNLKFWILKEDEEKKKNEWIQIYDVDMFRNTIVPRAFAESRTSPVSVAFVMHPTPKIIFGVASEELEDFRDDYEIDSYYSYDVKLKKLNSIIKTYGMHYKWHVSSLAQL